AFDAQRPRAAPGFLRESIQKRTAACVDRGTAAGKLDLLARQHTRERALAGLRSRRCRRRGGAAGRRGRREPARDAHRAAAAPDPGGTTSRLRQADRALARAGGGLLARERDALPGDRETHPAEARGIELIARLALHVALNPVARHR